ncbi:hypothetical protein EBQ81_02685, partial [bacterium]|nr:hypothetical protein [bacterium]
TGEEPVAVKDDEAAWKEYMNKNRRAMIILASSVEVSQMIYIKPHTFAKDAWAQLNKVYQQTTIANQLFLREQLRDIKQKDGEKVQEFVTRLLGIQQQLDGAGAQVEEQELVLKLLEGVLPKYRVFVTALEAQGGTLSFGEVVAKLQHEELRRHNHEDKEGALMGKHQGKQKGKPQGKQQKKCFHCNKAGHFKKDCYAYKRLQQQQQSKGVSEDHQASPASGNFVFHSATRGSPTEELTWYVDSGATKHMCSNRAAFSRLMEIAPEAVYMGNNAAVDAVGVGDVPVTTLVDGVEKEGHLANVLYVPELATNLISVKQMLGKGMIVNFAQDRCSIISPNGEVLGMAQLDGKLFKLQTARAACHFTAAVSLRTPAAEAQLWHERFGHMGMQSLQKLVSKEMVTGLPKTLPDLGEVCGGCMMGKQHRDSFPSEGKKASEPLALLHTDLCGPMSTPSMGKARYFLTFIDDATRFTHICFLQSKDQVFSKFKEFKALVENSTGRKIKALRSDRGTEYINKDMQSFLAEHGIRHDKTAPYTPQQNGVAERANRTIMECARSMLHSKGLPTELWAEAVATAVMLKNMSPTKVLCNITPAEAWTGKKPNAANLRIFGCRAYAHVPQQKRTKLEAKSKACIFVGYDLDSKAYRLLDPSTNSLIISRDVAFDEVHTQHQGMQGGHQQPPQEQLSAMLPILQGQTEEKDEDPLQSADQPVVNEGQDNPADHAEPEQGMRRSTRQRRPPSPYWIVSPEERAAVATNLVPLSFKEAKAGPDANHWIKATEEEYTSIMENGTWTLVQLPAGRKAVGCKWVYKKKRDAAGNIKRWKARLVAKGYSQVEGLDFTETFAPVAKFTSIRILLSLAAANNWECHHMDVKTAFLNGDLEEEIFMEQPEGFVKPGEEHLVCKLHKTIYGLKQSPRAWNKKLNDELKKQGFSRCEADHSVYFKRDNKGLVFLLVYVDDIIIVADSTAAMGACKEALSMTFTMTDLGETNHFLGMEVHRDRDAGLIFLNQRSYINSMLERYGMGDCAPVRIPLSVGAKLPPTTTEEKSFHHEYQSMVGSLMYLMVATRPDLAYAVGAVSQFAAGPSEEHLDAVKRILRYVRGTTHYQLTLGGDAATLQLEAWSDADWAANNIDRKSISGYCFKLGVGAVSWKSKKQTSVALSSTEAEYMALTQATKEAIWIRFLLTELGVFNDAAIRIKVDNQSCVALARNPEFHARTKHIDIQYHFIREKVEDNSVHLEFCPTDQMVADVFTKALPREKHVWCTNEMGVRSTV